MKTGGEEGRWDWSEVRVYESGRRSYVVVRNG